MDCGVHLVWKKQLQYESGADTLLVLRVIQVVARGGDMGKFFNQGTIGRQVDFHLNRSVIIKTTFFFSQLPEQIPINNESTVQAKMPHLS